jgi:hypothetical protein
MCNKAVGAEASFGVKVAMVAVVGEKRQHPRSGLCSGDLPAIGK